jgi:cytochrome c oxidase subunit I+III
MSAGFEPAALDTGDEKARLEHAWRSPPGFLGWLTATEHQTIGLRYIVTAFVFLILGGLEALAMRLQLAGPENNLLNPDLYNQVFTVHGTTMMFLFAVPVMEGMAIYLVPLMVGTRNVAFPRLNAFGYWMFLFGGIFLYAGFFFNTGADAGWFAYTPLSGPSFGPGKRVDFWAQMITFTEISALAVAVEILATIFRMRAPGMSIHRMPVYVWAMTVQSFMVMFAMPAVMLASTMLLLDRTVGTHFFNPAEGGDPLLWQHLFWFFGHPEVYIIFIPATGFVSAMLPVFTRRAIFGYTALVLALVSLAFVGFGLWVHHMFTTGLPLLGESYFTAASMMIAIPSGIQIFCWLATMWGAKLRFDTPMLFITAFIVLFVAGGMTGVMVASIPFDLQAHDTYFVVAHFHYVLIGGSVFPLIGAIYFWFPKMTGRMMSERLGKLNFWTLFLGFNLTFFPMHLLGLRGMPRRVYTYRPEMGWGGLNLLQTIGAFVIAAGGAMFITNVLRSRKHGRPAGPNPWNADGLEWSTASPPPNYNWERLPVVRGRHALWARHEDDPVVTGLATDRREVLATQVLDAEPDRRYVLPGATIWPLLTALAATVGFVGSVFNARWVIPGAILSGIALTGWFWPRGEQH